MEYPEEIYRTFNGGTLTDYHRDWGRDGAGRRHAYEVGYEVGKAEQADPLTGYSNLTAAIKAGEPIDWEKLDGLVAKCVHSTLGDLLYSLEVDGNGRKVIWESEGNFWFTTSGGNVWAEALREAWQGENGWTLWVEGEIPLRRKTADQLEVGTYFLGYAPGYKQGTAYVGGGEFDAEKRVHYAPSMRKSTTPASEWVVLEELGTFQKPEENKK